jgi:hypothetical protein
VGQPSVRCVKHAKHIEHAKRDGQPDACAAGACCFFSAGCNARVFHKLAVETRDGRQYADAGRAVEYTAIEQPTLEQSAFQPGAFSTGTIGTSAIELAGLFSAGRQHEV